MTLPSEEKWTLEQIKTFLRSLLYPIETPRVPLKIRKEAQRLLRHFPYQYRIDKFFEGEDGCG